MPQDLDGLDIAVGSHEDRLQRVENTTQGVAIKVAEISTKQDYMAEKLTDGLDEIKHTFSKLVDKVQDHDTRLAPVETSLKGFEKRRRSRGDLLKKTAYGALLAAGGVFATKGGEWLWNLLSK